MYVFIQHKWHEQDVTQGQYTNRLAQDSNLTSPISFSTTITMVTVIDFLIWFYGISTIMGYLMSNPLYTYIRSI